MTTGLSTILLIIALLEFPVCFALLKIFRRSVLKGMKSIVGREPASHDQTVSRRAPPSLLQTLVLDESLIRS